MPAARVYTSKYLVFKTVLVLIEGTDPTEYVESYEQVQLSITLDMNNFNSIYQYKDEYNEIDANLAYVLLDNGTTLLLKQNYEELNNAYTSYLNGG
jgi:hypothetical protein